MADKGLKKKQREDRPLSGLVSILENTQTAALLNFFSGSPRLFAALNIFNSALLYLQ